MKLKCKLGVLANMKALYPFNALYVGVIITIL